MVSIENSTTSFTINDDNAKDEELLYTKQIYKNVTDLDPGRTHTIKLTPNHKGNVGDTKILYVDLKPFPPTLKAGDIGKETEFKVHVHTNISNCDLVQIFTEPELATNHATSVPCVKGFKQSWEFKNLLPGTFVDISAVVIRNTLHSEPGYLSVATKPGTPQVLEQNYNSATNETLLKLFLPGYGRVLEVCLTHTNGTERCYEEGFQTIMRLQLDRDSYHAVMNLTIVGADNQTGESLNFIVGVALLTEVRFYEKDLDFNVYLHYTEHGPLTNVIIHCRPDVIYICSSLQKPCIIENVERRGINRQCKVTPSHNGVEQIKNTVLFFTPKPKISLTFSENNVFLEKEFSTDENYNLVLNFTYEGVFDYLFLEYGGTKETVLFGKFQ